MASASEKEVKEVKGLVFSPYSSLQFLELELKHTAFLLQKESKIKS